MGSSSSAHGLSCELPGCDLKLQETRLHFTLQQLRALNHKFEKLSEENASRQTWSELENTVEGLVQRLVDGAGQKDPRFRCQHIVALHRDKRIRSRSLEYLVTLDALPTLNTGDEECCLQEGPAGYARVKLSGKLADQWQDLVTPAGYLWRAAVVERWVELVAGCAAEARQARSGGAARVLGVLAASVAVPHQYCYLEKPSRPASSDYRLAIVSGAAWVHVRACTSAGVEAEAKLVLAVRGAGGTANAAHPARLPLAHPAALLHYDAAATGFYATAVGPPSSLSCPERQASWQLWHPALEGTLDAHYSDRSGVGRVFNVLKAVVDLLRDGRVKPGLRVLSRYAVSCTLRRRLELLSCAPTAPARAVLGIHLSHHVLCLLDRMVTLCAARRCDSYVYDTPLLARGGARSSEADWRADAVCISNYLNLLHAESAAVEEIPPTPSEALESVLFRRWEGLMREMKVNMVSGTPHTYTRRQLLYVARVCRELIAYKKNVPQEKHSVFRTNLINATSQNQEPYEDLIHILAIMLDQARDQYLMSQRHTKCGNQTSDIQQERQSYKSKKLNKMKEFYDVSSACLIDAVRRDPNITRNEDLTDEVNKIKNVLVWMHKGMKDDKKYLGPVVKPFLEALHSSSHENCWFLEEYEAKKLEKEYRGLRRYCLGVHAGSVDPCMGLLDAAKKYAWAKAMVDLADRSRHSGLKLVFPGTDGSRVTCAVHLPTRREDESARRLTLTRQDKAEAKGTLATRCVINAFAAAFNPHTHILDIATLSSNRSEEFFSSTKTGQYWRNTTKPDIVTSNLLELGSTSTSSLNPDPAVPKPRRPRKQRPVSNYGYPDIPINLTNGNSMSTRKKYHTLKSLVYSDSVESIRELRERPRSAGNTLKAKQPMSRPSLLETLDFINGVKDALCVEESGASDLEDSYTEDETLLREVSPLNLLARLSRADVPHNTLANIVAALIAMNKFTILQELSTWLGEGRSGALFALHRLARGARSRSHSMDRRSRLGSESSDHSEHPQRYTRRPPDYFSGDEAPKPPPRPTTTLSQQQTRQPRARYTDYSPPKRHQENPLNELTKSLSVLNLSPPKQGPSQERPLALLNEEYTGIINPVYHEKREKFSNKRSKSLGRSFSTRKTVLEATRHNITLGPRSGRYTNDVVNALMGTTGETGLDYKGTYFQRLNRSGVVGEGYKVSWVRID